MVDDTAVDRAVARSLLEKHGGWRVELAKDGAAALAAITRAAPAAVLTDLQMPNLNGLELVKQVRERFPHVPVILMTGTGSEDIALAALRAGAASYVPKRNLATDLVTVVEQALSASQADVHRARGLALLSKQVSQYKLTNDIADARALTHIVRGQLVAFELSDATGATRTSIALEEALLNAVYHGTLNVSPKLKALCEGSFERAAAVRRREVLYQDRLVSVTVDLTPQEVRFLIADEGDGFDVSALPARLDPADLALPGRRGVFIMRTFMDEVRYNRTGNQVTLVKRREPRDQCAPCSLPPDRGPPAARSLDQPKPPGNDGLPDAPFNPYANGKRTAF